MKTAIFYLFLLLGVKYYLGWSNPLILGIALFMLIHELGHAFSASLYGRFKRFGFLAGNPGVVISSDTEKGSKTITLSGMIFNLVTFPIIGVLLELNLLKYLILCIGVSLFDLVKLYNYITGRVET